MPIPQVGAPRGPPRLPWTNASEIARVVPQDLLPQIVRRAERHPRQDEPIGDTRRWWAKAQMMDRDAVVKIEVESQRIDSREWRLSELTLCRPFRATQARAMNVGPWLGHRSSRCVFHSALSESSSINQNGLRSLGSMKLVLAVNRRCAKAGRRHG
jgi:hypothetical protein